MQLQDCLEASPMDGDPALTDADRAYLNDAFGVHALGPEQMDKMYEINGAAREFAEAILVNVPASADRSSALRAVREARNWAHEAIELAGRR